MASAAAVATTVDQSPPPFQETDEITNTTATVIGADEKLPDEVDGDDDDDEDVALPTRRNVVAPTSAATQVDDEDDLPNGDEDDDIDEQLFGSDPEEDGFPKPRQLDDEDLDSGDDEGRNDRVAKDDDVVLDDHQVEEEELMFMDASLPRQPAPEPTDGELYLLKVPRFLSVEPHAFNPENFRPPTTDHHSKETPSSAFSAYNTALTTIRWRPSPTSPSHLQSNARIIRWSDGSLTLQMANEPRTQYSIRGRPLAPPQTHPPKPTPLTGNLNKSKKPYQYKVEDESFTYLAAPNMSSQLLRITNKFTTSLTVDPASNSNNDAATERLRAGYAALQGGSMGEMEVGGMGTIHVTEDPELSKKKAELAEKEKMRAQRRREAQEQRERERGVGPRGGYGRHGGRAGGTGLTVGGLEDEDELGRGVSGRAAGAGRSRAKAPKKNRRGEIWTDEEEDYGRRTRTKEDEYDEEDDFVARSDEEEEVEESDGDEDEGIVLESRSAARRQPDAGTTRAAGKRDLDVDAEGDVDEEVVRTSGAVDRGRASSPVGRTAKKRRVIEDDDDEE